VTAIDVLVRGPGTCCSLHIRCVFVVLVIVGVLRWCLKLVLVLLCCLAVCGRGYTTLFYLNIKRARHDLEKWFSAFDAFSYT
jgi:hypothetical protein